MPHVSHPTLCSQVPRGSLGLAGEQRLRALRRLIDVAMTPNGVIMWGRTPCESQMMERVGKGLAVGDWRATASVLNQP